MPPEPPPIPINLLWEIFPTALRVGFDRPLIPGILDPTIWLARRLNQRLRWGSAVTVGASVLLTNSVITGPDPGVDQAVYTPPPFDVISTFDKPAAAFTFPP